MDESRQEKQIPAIIKSVGFDFTWDVAKVWEIDAPVEQMPISKLDWHFVIPFLDTLNGWYDLTSEAVITHPHLYPQQHERTMLANLEYPIDVMENKGRLLILDGLHRLMKAVIEGQQNVAVRVIPRSAIPQITKQ